MPSTHGSYPLSRTTSASMWSTTTTHNGGLRWRMRWSKVAFAPHQNQKAARTCWCTHPLGSKNDNDNSLSKIAFIFKRVRNMERTTKQRQAIRDVIAAAVSPLLPNEVLQRAQQEVPALGIATVYRNLQALTASGDIKPVHLPGENPRFEISDQRHHHYFKCTQCASVANIWACPSSMDKLAPEGFVVHSHELTLYGLCKTCAHNQESTSHMPSHSCPSHL